MPTAAPTIYQWPSQWLCLSYTPQLRPSGYASAIHDYTHGDAYDNNHGYAYDYIHGYAPRLCPQTIFMAVYTSQKVSLGLGAPMIHKR